MQDFVIDHQKYMRQDSIKNKADKLEKLNLKNSNLNSDLQISLELELN